MRIGMYLCLVVVVMLAKACTGGGGIKCSDKEPCTGGLVCVSGECVKKRCSIDEQCDFNEYCDKGTRECRRKDGPSWTCRTQSDCRQGETCQSGFCRLGSQEPVNPPDKDPNVCDPACASGSRCEAGKCVKIPEDLPCKFDSDCKDGLKCNLAADRCQKSCTADTDCPPERRCTGGFCQINQGDECGPNKPCPSPKSCKDGKCVEPPAECGPTNPCPSPKSCENGKCVDPPAECGPNKACPSPKICKEGKCVDETPAACGPTNPCPATQKCWKGTCAPADYCEQTSDCPPDQNCFRNKCNACQQDTDCPTHQSCVQGVCDFKQKQFGEECAASVQCVTNAICLGDGSGKSYCRKACDPALAAASGCSASEGCALLSDNKSGACLPKIGAGALGPGQACDPNNVKCEVDLVCVNDGGKDICMQLCHTQQQNCPNAAKCVSVSIDPIGVCEVKGGSTSGGEGSACTAQSQCQSGLLCLQFAPGQGACTPPCDPYNPSCSGGKICDLIMDYANRNLQAAVCGPFIAGVGDGQICNYQYHTAGSCPGSQPQCLCQSNMFCFLNLQNPTSSLCALPCDPNTKRCPAGKQCIISPILWKGANLWGCI